MARRRLVVAAFAAVAAMLWATLAAASIIRDSAPGPPLQVASAAQLVAQRVMYADHVLASSHKRVPRGYLVALATMSYIVGHVSASQYGYLNEIAHEPLPADANSTLAAQAGICGGATTTMLAILEKLHLPARRVDVYYPTPATPSNGHTTVEVKYDGRWHWFDPTWGTVYVPSGKPQSDVLSLVQVLNLPAALRAKYRIGNDARLWEQTVLAAGPELGRETGMLFLTLPHLRVEVSGRVVYSR